MFDRKTHWRNVYQGKTPVEVSWYQKEPTLSLELIGQSEIGHDEPIIDVGGGASLLVDCLHKAGYTNLTVLDISQAALAHTRERLGDQARGITWLETDITEFKAYKQFSLWHDRAVFHFLTDKLDRERYVAALKWALRSQGRPIIAAFAIDGPSKCSDLDIVQYHSAKIINELGDEFELIDEKNEVHKTPVNKARKFVYYHFVRKAY
jgi:ubiquinone/menaquinone biosynthesis C-methylase UbiE